MLTWMIPKKYLSNFDKAIPLMRAGADLLFIDALDSLEEMRALTSLPGAAASAFKVNFLAQHQLSVVLSLLMHADTALGCRRLRLHGESHLRLHLSADCAALLRTPFHVGVAAGHSRGRLHGQHLAPRSAVSLSV